MPSPRQLIFTPLAIVALVDMVDGWIAADPKLADRQTGLVTLTSGIAFDSLSQRLSQATNAHDAELTRAGDPHGHLSCVNAQIVGLFRNSGARRMLVESMVLGPEAPLRFHLAESRAGVCSLSYQRPSATFAPYMAEAGDTLRTMAAELDRVFADIAAKALGT